MNPTFRGTIQEGDVTLVALRARDAEVATHRKAGTLTVRLEDDSGMVIEVPDAAILQGETKTTRGAWSDLRELPQANGLARDLEQPFAEVELVEVVLVVGTLIVVCGELVDIAFAADGGPREAPSQTPVLRAAFLGAGPHATRLVDAMLEARRGAEALRQPPARPKKPTDSGDPATASGFSVELMIVLVVGVMGIGFGLMQGMRGRGAAVVAVVLAGAAFAARSDRKVPEFWQRDEQIKNGTIPFTIGAVVAALAMGLVTIGSTRAPIWWVVAWLVILAGVVAMQVLSNAPSYRRLRELARAPRTAPADAIGAWITVEGALQPTARGSGAKLLVRSETHTYISLGKRSPDEIKSRKVTGDQAFAIVTADGTVLVIEREDVTWASTHGIHADRQAGRGSTVTDEDHLIAGGRIAACGKVERRSDGRLALRSSGTRPVIVLATSPAGRPLAFAEALVTGRLVTLIGLAVTAAGVGAVAAFVR